MEPTASPATNPALELFDLIVPAWTFVGTGAQPLILRIKALKERDPEANIWEQIGHANHLLDKVQEYLSERATLTDRQPTGGNQIERLRRGINTPGQGLLATQSQDWRPFTTDDLDWLESIGQTWDRRVFAPHLADMPEIKGLADLAADVVREAPELSDMHRDYLLTLAEALGKAAGAAAEDGEIPVTRLVIELRGALETFLPKADDQTTKSVKERLKNFGETLLIGVSSKVAVELVTRPGTLHAIEAGARAIGM